jgi:hypothetical protein
LQQWINIWPCWILNLKINEAQLDTYATIEFYRERESDMCACIGSIWRVLNELSEKTIKIFIFRIDETKVIQSVSIFVMTMKDIWYMYQVNKIKKKEDYLYLSLLFILGDILHQQCKFDWYYLWNCCCCFLIRWNSSNTWRRYIWQSCRSSWSSRVKINFCYDLFIFCFLSDGNSRLALKIIKNVDKYREAARLEINVLKTIKDKDPDGVK